MAVARWPMGIRQLFRFQIMDFNPDPIIALIDIPRQKNQVLMPILGIFQIMPGFFNHHRIKAERL